MAKKLGTVTYDEKKDLLKYGDKVLRSNNSAYKKLIVAYVGGKVAQGESLERILPAESTKALPDIMQFMDIVNSSEELQSKYNKAKSARYILESERLVSLVRKYERDPSPHNTELLKATSKALDYLEKGGVDNNSLVIEVKTMAPKDFWTHTDYALEGNKHDK